MQTFISTKDLYSNIKKVNEQVQKGMTFVVLKYSRPAYKITPLEQADTEISKQYTLKDISKFTFTSKNPEKNLAIDFKKHIYS